MTYDSDENESDLLPKRVDDLSQLEPKMWIKKYTGWLLIIAVELSHQNLI